jgi:uncharacterized membrane protein (DUF4010 family)
MNQDDVIRMAQKADLYLATDVNWMPIIGLEHAGKFAALAFAAGAAHERERCVKLLEDFSQTTMVPVVDTWRMGLIAGANAIRARGDKQCGSA